MLTDFLFLSLQVSHLHQYILSLSLILTVIDDELKKVRIPCHYRLNVFSCIGGYKYQLWTIAQSSQSSYTSEALVDTACLCRVCHIAILRNAGGVVFHRNNSFITIYLYVYFICSLFKKRHLNSFVHLVCRILYIFSENEAAVLIHSQSQRFDDIFTDFSVILDYFFFCHD